MARVSDEIEVASRFILRALILAELREVEIGGVLLDPREAPVM